MLMALFHAVIAAHTCTVVEITEPESYGRLPHNPSLRCRESVRNAAALFVGVYTES